MWREQLKARVLGISDSLVAAIIIYIAVGIFAWYSAHTFQVAGFPRHWAILVGVGVFLAVATGLNLLSLIIVRHRKRKAKVLTSEEKSLPSDVERIEALERENRDLKSKLEKVADLKYQYESLRTLAMNQRGSINGYVWVQESNICGHNFLNELYVDFKFVILNTSVHTISIEDSIKGDIKLDSRLLSKSVKMKENNAKGCKNNELKDFTVRQWLDRDEINDILQAKDDACKFQFHGLEITIKGEDFGDLTAIPRSLSMYRLTVSSTRLRELSRKLEIEIQESSFCGYWKLSKAEQLGTQVNMQISVRNPRINDVEIKEFRLTIKAAGKTYTQSAQAGEIFDTHKIGENGEFEHFGSPLENINLPIIIKSKSTIDGWLKFIFNEPNLNQSESYTPILSIIDSSDEEHPAECLIRYK